MTTTTTTKPAGLLAPGDLVCTGTAWHPVEAIRLAPDHAAVVIVTADGRDYRRHCDHPVLVREG